MLRSMRHGALSGVFIAILALGTFGLVMTDWQGMFRGGVSSNDVAEVGGTVIPAQSFDRMLRNTLRNQNITIQDAYDLGMIDSVLSNEIAQIVLYKEAHEMGIKIPDEAVVDNVTQTLQPLIQQGMTRREALNRVLQSTGMSERGLLEIVRREMAVNLLTETLTKTKISIPSFFVQDIMQIRRQTRSLSVLEFPHDSVEVAEPSEEQLTEFYEQIKARLQPPETRDIALVILNTEDLAEQIELADSELEAYYAQNLESFKVPEQRTVEQAIFDTQETAQRVASKFEESKNLKASVEKVTGASDAYLGREDFQANGLLEEIADPVFKAETRTLVGPIKSPLGWHLFYVASITPENTKPFAEVKETIQTTLKANLLQDELYAISNELDDRLAGGDSLENIKKDFPVEVKQGAEVGAGAPVPFDEIESEESKEIFGSVFDLYEGESTPVSELDNARFFTFVVQKINTPPVPELAEIKDKLKVEWMQTEAMRQNFKNAETLYQEVKSSGDALDTYSKKNGKDLKQITIKESDTPPLGLARNSFLQLFALKQNGVALLPSENGLLLARLDNIQFPESDLLPSKEVKEEQKLFADSMTQSIFNTYMKALEDKYNVGINNDLIDRLYGPQQDVATN